MIEELLTTSDGRVIPLSQMTDEHLDNAIAYLECRLPDFAEQYGRLVGELYRRRHTGRVVSPFDIFALARDNIAVAACVDNWKHGSLSWEQMLMECVCILAEAYKDLLDELLKQQVSA